MLPRLLTISGFFALAAATSSAQLSDIFLSETTGDQVARLSDRNGDGDMLEANEAFRFMRDVGAIDPGNSFNGGLSSPRAAVSAMENGKPVLYVIDTTDDCIYRGDDLNGDGVIEEAEVSIYRIVDNMDGATSPDHIEVANDGAVWYCSDGGFGKLVRCADADADGDADLMAEGVTVIDDPFAGGGAQPDVGIPVWVGDSASSVTCPEPPAGLDPFSGHWFRYGMAPAGAKGMVMFSRNTNAAYLCSDANDNGDFSDSGDISLFLNATGEHSGLPQNPDFAVVGGTLPHLYFLDYGTDNAPGGGDDYNGWNYLDLWDSQDEGGTEAFYMASTRSVSQETGFNTDGDRIAGVIFRGVDNNADGDINDAGEVTLWHDNVVAGFDDILSIDAGPDGLYVADLTGGALNIYRVSDIDSSGSIDQAGEIVNVFDLSPYDNLGLLGGDPLVDDDSCPPFEAEFAFTYDIAVAGAGEWRRGSSGVTIDSGAGCTKLASQPTLAMHGTFSAADTSDLIVEVNDAPATTLAILQIGVSNTDWQGVPNILPFDFGLVDAALAGCTLYQSADIEIQWPVLIDGTGSLGIPIPIDASFATFIGAPIHFQYVIFDVVAAIGGADWQDAIAFTNYGSAIISK
jgi:hypothetical protein